MATRNLAPVAPHDNGLAALCAAAPDLPAAARICADMALARALVVGMRRLDKDIPAAIRDLRNKAETMASMGLAHRAAEAARLADAIATAAMEA